MKHFKEGDIVKIHDGSYSQVITEEGKIEDTHGLQLVGRKFKVIATGCDLPGESCSHTASKERNNTILRALDNNQIVFIQSRMFKLAHRCNCCPNCGKEI